MAGNEAMLIHHRRVLTMQSQVAEQEGQPNLAGSMRALRDEVAGTPLPDSFPHRTQVIDAGYKATEDLQDVPEDELVARGLTRRRAKDVIAALAALQEA